ncbi:MAG: hypothetical protein BGO11_08900 [Solirubrobacterales bacterium 70-9]|nr:MAG: hypothetical protein BGO11_08900 [Solirubrobacterales bacterium 70-9]
MRETGSNRVLIVGAGVAGSTLAVALHARGVEIELVEIQPEWKPLGTGLMLMGPSLRALRGLDLIDDAVAGGAGLYHFAVGDEAGNPTSVTDLPRLAGDEYPACIELGRPAFHGILAKEMRRAGVPVRLGLTIDAIDENDNAVDVTFSDGESARYRAVVGADGAYSGVRRLIFPELGAPRPSGQALWRAMVDRPPELGSNFQEGTVYMLYGPHNKAMIIPTSPRQLYIALTENGAGHDRPDDAVLPELMRAHLADYRGFVAVLRDQITDPSQVIWRRLEVLLVKPAWHRGRTILIGDAAHTTTPNLASGAGMAIEDGVVLAEELSGEGPVEAAFERFMSRRYERCRMVVENSAQLSEWEQRPVPGADPIALTDESWRVLSQPI